MSVVPEGLRIKRIYDPCEPEDGVRVLVDRLWPRGVRKSEAKIDIWLKDIAPEPALREWFGHDPKRFDDFRIAYEHQLGTYEPSVDAAKLILKRLATDRVTLLYAARDPVHNHAVILYSFLENKLGN